MFVRVNQTLTLPLAKERVWVYVLIISKKT